jgi:hypothetical protein
MPARQKPDRFTLAVRTVFGRLASARKIEALRLELTRAGIGGLGTEPSPRPRPKVASKASELAGQQIDELGDPSATDEERQTRKQRLLRGPREFRDIRGDLPKSKG